MTTRAKTQPDAVEDTAPAGDEGEPLTVDEAGAAEARAKSARETALHRRRVQYGEYGQWVAAYDIRGDNGALMFAAGHPVPVDQVDDESRAVIIARHRCHHTPDVRCDEFNAPELWSEPDAVVRPAGFEEE